MRLIRAPMAGRVASSRAGVSIDVVLFTCHERRLRVLVESSGNQRASLPWGPLIRSEALDAAAARIARRSAGAVPDWMEQVGAFTAGPTHPSGAALSVAYVGVRPWIDLQATYETILARRLHKASFRRALQAAFLVDPTGEQRGEGRGRPAQLFRFAPRRRKSARRGVRLDLL